MVVDTSHNTTADEKDLAAKLEVLKRDAQRADTAVNEAVIAMQEATEAMKRARDIAQDTTRDALLSKEKAIEATKEAREIGERYQ